MRSFVDVGVGEQEEEEEERGVSGSDGRADSMGEAVGADQALLRWRRDGSPVV